MRRVVSQLLGFFVLSLKEQGGISSRRLTLFVCVLTLVFSIFANLCFGKVLNPDLLYCLTGVIGGCMGTMTVERGMLDYRNKQVLTTSKVEYNGKEGKEGKGL